MTLGDKLLYLSVAGGVALYIQFRFWPKPTRKAINSMLATLWAAKQIKDDKADHAPAVPSFDTVKIPKVPHPKHKPPSVEKIEDEEGG